MRPPTRGVPGGKPWNGLAGQHRKSSGAALGSQAYKKCRALLEDKMGIENDVLPDRSYASSRGR
jgi:hypothetical protein